MMFQLCLSPSTNFYVGLKDSCHIIETRILYFINCVCNIPLNEISASTSLVSLPELLFSLLCWGVAEGSLVSDKLFTLLSCFDWRCPGFLITFPFLLSWSWELLVCKQLTDLDCLTLLFVGLCILIFCMCHPLAKQ